MRFRSICASVLITATAAGCSSSARWGHYEIPFDEARARLMKADIVGFRNARQCGYLIHFALNTPDPQSVGWVVTYKERIVAKFFVRLTPTESGVDFDFNIPPGQNGGEIYDGKQTYDYPVLLQPLRPALQELVDSAMTRRPFEWQRLQEEQAPVYFSFNAIDSSKTTGTLSKTQNSCLEGRQGLERGKPWSMDDPPGFPPMDPAWPKQARQ